MDKKYNQIKTWITLTADGSGFPVAQHLQLEGKEVIVGQVQDKSELKTGEKEEPEDKKKRLTSFEGIVKKYPADKLVKALKKVKNKDDYYIYCDRNNLWFYAEQLVKAGFKNGIFPTKADFDLEKEREQAMSFVEDHYTDIQIIPFQKVSTVEEARTLVEEAETPLVIQSEGDFVNTVVGPDDVEQSRQVILATLDKHEKEYARGEIILKQKLVAPVEITPQIVFWNGEVVYTSLDIETKNVGDGENNGPQVGCGTNLIIRTELKDYINEIAFPPKVYEMAKEHKGLFIFDISIYVTEEGMFFGEFCSNRFGYDALFTEITMAHGPSEYFEKIMLGENPIEHFKYGIAVRAFNVKLKDEQEIQYDNWKPIWLYDAKMKDDKIVTVGEDWDLAVVTGRGNSILEAVENGYNNYNRLVFKEKYCRTKEDFLADYPTSIMRRYRSTRGIYFEGQEFRTKDEDHKEEMEQFKGKVKKRLYGLIRR